MTENASIFSIMLSGKHTFYCVEKDVSAGKEDTNKMVLVALVFLAGFALSVCLIPHHLRACRPACMPPSSSQICSSGTRSYVVQFTLSYVLLFPSLAY